MRYQLRVIDIQAALEDEPERYKETVERGNNHSTLLAKALELAAQYVRGGYVLRAQQKAGGVDIEYYFDLYGLGGTGSRARIIVSNVVKNEMDADFDTIVVTGGAIVSRLEK